MEGTLFGHRSASVYGFLKDQCKHPSGLFDENFWA